MNYDATIELLMGLRRDHFATHQGEGYEELTNVYLAVCRAKRQAAKVAQNQRVAA